MSSVTDQTLLTHQLIDQYPFPNEKDQVCLPDKYKEQFMKLLEDMEKETGTMFTVEITRLGVHRKLRFKPFDKRENFIVYEANPGYEKIEGMYKTVGDIGKKIGMLRAEELGVINGTWTCTKCQYKNEFSYSYGHTYGHCCEGNCETPSRHTRWDDAEIYVQGLNIAIGDDVKQPICKLKFA